jgi:hypothetical protein
LEIEYLDSLLDFHGLAQLAKHISATLSLSYNRLTLCGFTAPKFEV